MSDVQEAVLVVVEVAWVLGAALTARIASA